jgi:hypothetical protein
LFPRIAKYAWLVKTFVRDYQEKQNQQKNAYRLNTLPALALRRFHAWRAEGRSLRGPESHAEFALAIA